jgi:hypothetical protein
MSLSDTGGWHWFGTKYGTSLAPESGTPPPGGDTPSRVCSYTRKGAINGSQKKFVLSA